MERMLKLGRPAECPLQLPELSVLGLPPFAGALQDALLSNLTVLCALPRP